MARAKTAYIMVYMEPLLLTLVQEGILANEPNMTSSEYGRNLIFQDLKARNLITSEIQDALITGTPLKPKAA